MLQKQILCRNVWYPWQCGKREFFITCGYLPFCPMKLVKKILSQFQTATQQGPLQLHFSALNIAIIIIHQKSKELASVICG